VARADVEEAEKPASGDRSLKISQFSHLLK